MALFNGKHLIYNNKLKKQLTPTKRDHVLKYTNVQQRKRKPQVIICSAIKVQWKGGYLRVLEVLKCAVKFWHDAFWVIINIREFHFFYFPRKMWIFFILDDPRMLITSYFTTKESVINITGQGRTKLYKSLPIEKKMQT